MAFISNYIKYLQDDAEQDRQIKTVWKIAIRYLLVFILYILQWFDLLTYTNAQEINAVLLTLANVFFAKDLLLSYFGKVKALQQIDAWYNMLIEGMIVLAIIPVNLIFNMGEEFAYNITQITPAFIVAIGLYLFVMSVLNLGLGYYQYRKVGKLKNDGFVVGHNAWIIVQCVLLISFGLGLYGALDYSDFYSEIFKFIFGRF